MEPSRNIYNPKHSGPKITIAISPQAHVLELESHYSSQCDAFLADWFHTNHADTSQGSTYCNDSNSVSSCSLLGTPEISEDCTANNYADLLQNNYSVNILDTFLFMKPLQQDETQSSASELLSPRPRYKTSSFSSYQPYNVGDENESLHEASSSLSHTFHMGQVGSLPANRTICYQFDDSYKSLQSSNTESYLPNAQLGLWADPSSISSNIISNSNCCTYYSKHQHIINSDQNSQSRQQHEQLQQHQEHQHHQQHQYHYDQQQQHQQQQHNQLKYVHGQSCYNQMITTTEAVTDTYSNIISMSINNEGNAMIRQDNSQWNITPKRYHCLYPGCHKVFRRPYNLKSHSRTHTKEKPHVCPVCQNKFARPHDLKRHELLHTGEKPHKCRFCQKRFARSDAVKRHCQKDINCKLALAEETRLNGGKEVKTRRKRCTK